MSGLEKLLAVKMSRVLVSGGWGEVYLQRVKVYLDSENKII